MAEENQVVEPVSQAAPIEAEPSPVESSARTMGWVPKDEYEGDEVQWLDANEFVRRQPLFEKIAKQNKELKEIKRTMQQFASHHAQVKETEYQRALDSLKAQKVAAFEDGDATKIVKIEDDIKVVEKAQERFNAEQAANVRQEAQEIHPEFQAWQNRNTWYTTDRAMKAFADVVGAEYSANGTRQPAEVLKEVERRVRDEFPKRFTNANREKPGAVESSSAKGNKSSSGYTPSDFERQAATKFVQQGLFKSVDDYYKELKILNGKS